MLDVLSWRINKGANRDVYAHSGDRSLCQTPSTSLAVSVNFYGEDASGV